MPPLSMSRLPYKWIVATVFMFGLFMDLMDTTIVNIALPTLSRDFHASTSAVEWTVTGYLLSLAMVIPAAGFLADRFGTKRIFMAAMGIFVVASAACGQAHSIQELVAFRFLQGVGGGMMTPVGTAMLSREFPGAERAKASALISVPVVLAPTVGPVLGGFLTEYVSWRWIFYVNLPVGVLGFAIAWRYLKEQRQAYARNSIDFAGLVTGSAGAAMTLYAVSEAGPLGWTAGRVVGFGLGGLALMAAFALIEMRVRFPILDLRLFKRWFFTSGNLMMMPAFGAFGGFVLLLTLFLQQLRGFTALEAGLIQAPSSIGTAISLPLASRLYPKMGPRRMMLIGFFFAAVTILPFHWVGLDTPVWVIVVLLLLRGLPFAFGVVASQTLIFGPIESEKQGPASSIYNTLRQVAASFGVALIITISMNRQHAHQSAALASQHLAQPTREIATHAAVLGTQEAYIAVFLLLLIPFLLAFTINDERAAEQLARRMPTVTPVE